MSRYVQQKEKPKSPKKTERKVPLSQPGVFNKKTMEAAKPLYTGRNKV